MIAVTAVTADDCSQELTAVFSNVWVTGDSDKIFHYNVVWKIPAWNGYMGE